jgi:glutaredoxin-like protein
MKACLVRCVDYVVRAALGKDPVVSQYITSFSATRFETEHPVVRVHPETGERALLLGGFARHLIGLTTSESAAILGVLQARATIPDHTVRWNWSASDVAMWDNRATQHCAVADYGAQRRSLSRITLAGDIPVGVTGERSRAIAGDASDFSSVAEPGLPSPSAVSPGWRPNPAGSLWRRDALILGMTVSSAPLTMYTTSWCGYCVRLKTMLKSAGISYEEVNIEQDPAAAEFVCSVNGGNQTVPTVKFADGSTLTNPSGAEIKQKLAEIA